MYGIRVTSSVPNPRQQLSPELYPNRIGISGLTTPITNRIRFVPSAAILLLFVAGVIGAPLALISRVEHSHPLALDGQQLAHPHARSDNRLDHGRSHHPSHAHPSHAHPSHAHHSHAHSHHQHAEPESTEVDAESGSNRDTTESEISASSQHQHFNLFGLRFTIHLNGRSSDAASIEESRSVDFGLLVARALDIRSSMPPADVTVDSCHFWQPLLPDDSLDDGCETDRPETPPPESAFC